MPRGYPDNDLVKLKELVRVKEYNDCIKFKQADWASAVLYRLGLRNEIAYEKNSDNANLRTRLQTKLENFFANPLEFKSIDFGFIRVLGDMSLGDLVDAYVAFNNSPSLFLLRAVENFPAASEIFGTEDSLKPDRDVSIYDYFRNEDNWIDPEYLNPGECFLRVDIGAGDDQLKHEFSEWLATKRLAQERLSDAVPTSKEFSPADLMRWTNLRVLAYIDMEIAVKYLGLDQPTPAAAAELLFPEPGEASQDRTSKIKTSVKPEVAKLKSLATIYKLMTSASSGRPLKETRKSD